MTIPESATLLRIFVGEQDRFEHERLYEAIVLRARDHGLAGATVLRGLLGYGESSMLHATKTLRLSGNPPIVVEIVDAEHQIESFLPILAEMLPGGGLVTLAKIRVLRDRLRPES